MGVYFARVGLEQADQSASVIGAFIALASLALALYGTLTDRRADPTSELAPDAAATPNNKKTEMLGSGGARNEISGGGTFYGPVMQGHDFDHITLGSLAPPRPVSPSDAPRDTAG
ncbi:hypothetical protein [Streptosporangium subroseum]|uniref:hypothetical protein n=1 Tax=Streptosporangium subroseum TaxID=106412 RepID=UPI003090B65E|nr:hypothetical protein OHB15_03325 [Streptosporangium subroseum]